MDNLFEQMANISKASAYDILLNQVKELKEENKRLKHSISVILPCAENLPQSELKNEILSWLKYANK